jgi:uncharacterized protein
MSASESPDDVKVAGLFSYPVKGCRAVVHTSVQVLASGLAHDRSWMLVDPRPTPRRFITQREHPALATIAVNATGDGSIELSQAGRKTTRVAMPTSPQSLCKVKVWSSEVAALDAGDTAASWLAAAIGVSIGHVRLVRFHPDEVRRCNPIYAGETGAHTLFADGYPILVTSVASLADLNRRMGRDAANAVPMNRFRPNVVLSGLPAWDEDHIDEIEIGDVRLKLVKPCVRCEVTTTDQASGARVSDEPLNTLARFRNNPDLGGVTFGWNAIVLNTGRIEPGSEATVNYRF